MAYVYLHSKPSGEIFYVGKGNGRRAWAKNKRSEYWKRTAAKYGYNVSIFLDNVSDEKALSVEKDLIEAIGLDNLVNFTNGGEGCIGYKHTEESLKKISKTHKGRKRSKETRKRISESLKGRVAHNKGKKMPDEQRERLFKKLLDTRTGTIYKSIQDFCKETETSVATFYANDRGRTKVNKFKHIKRL